MTKTEAVKILGLSMRYSQDDLRSAYRKMAMKYHPDRAGKEYTDTFAKINEAYTYLSELGENVGCTLTHSTIFTVMRS